MTRPPITVAVCTYLRPEMLRRLLEQLDCQICAEFDFDVVVIDNDSTGSAREVVEQAGTRVKYSLRYVIERTNNIANARNRAIQLGSGRFLAFIDDDEYPSPRWLSLLLNAQAESGADAVLGPVIPSYVNAPKTWVTRSGLCDRVRYPTGTEIPWRKTRTGNVLFDREAAVRHSIYFDDQYGVLGGEDVTFFRRYLAGTRRAIWCDEAVVFEWVPETRTRLRWFLKRAFVQGHVSFHYGGIRATPFRRVAVLARELVATVCYLPIILLSVPFGFHRFARFLVKCTHHVSRSLTALGIARLRRRAL